MSSVAHRSNEVMKVLTMVSSIFVPMTFVAGVYGMNFEHMPEISYAWSYPLALLAMVASAMAMIVFFFRRGWFGPVSLRVGAATQRMTIGVRGGDDRDELRTMMANGSSMTQTPRADSRPTHSAAA